MIEETPPMPLPAPANPGSDRPLSGLELYRRSLDRSPDDEIARLYDEQSAKVAQLETELGHSRRILAILGQVFSARLKRRDRFGYGEFHGRYYRAHKDGGGVRREPTRDPRWVEDSFDG
jgi:hypothetical protein